MTRIPPPPIGHARAEADTTAPDGSQIRLLVAEAQGATRASLCEVRLAAGAVSRAVSHASVEEIWYVVAGRGRVWRAPRKADAAPLAVGPGDALTIPVGWRFQFAADPDGDLRFLCFTAPPWPGAEEARAEARGGLGRATV